MQRISLFLPALALIFSMCSTTKTTTTAESVDDNSTKQSSVDTFVVMCYNVENFFHPDDDPTKSDDAFTPDGDYHWSYSKASEKAKKIGRVIVSANGWNQPHVIGLCEVEGPDAVEFLLAKSGLEKLGYRAICYPTPDMRGIATAMFYDSDFVKVIDSKPICVSVPEKDLLTRDILYAKLAFESDTFHIMVNHWPSKYGGEQESVWKRNHVAQLARHACDSIRATEPEAKIIVMGDFNDGAESDAITTEFGATSEMGDFVNLSSDTKKSSYKYQGKWGTIDHIIVSRALCEAERPEFTVCDLPFLKESDESFSGDKPFRTFIGMKFNGGYSDHFPVMIKIPVK